MIFFRKTKKIIVHSGAFHPDDVFAVAVLEMVLSSLGHKWRIVRTRDKQEFKSANYLIDVGGEYDEENNKFDHHQIGGAGKRENGVPYASFGLVWKKFGKILTKNNNKLTEEIDKKLVQPIDALDNGEGTFHPILPEVFPYTIGHFIRSLNADWATGFNESIVNKKFNEAVSFARKVLATEIDAVQSEILAEKELDVLYQNTEDKRILILDKNYFWNYYLQKYPEVLFVIEPAKEGGSFEVEAVKKNKYDFENRLDLPLDWAGKQGEELAKISGVADAVFCHNKRFFAVAKTLEGAKSLAVNAINLDRENLNNKMI